MILCIMGTVIKYRRETIEKLFKIPVEDQTHKCFHSLKDIRVQVQKLFFFFFKFHIMAFPPLSKFKINPQKYLMEKIKESLLGSSQYQ